MIVPPQLTLDLLAPEACSFDNFLAGENEELVAQMRDLAEGRRSEPCLFLWGEAGAGKTHLLQAALGAAVTAGRKALLLGRDAILSVSGEPALIAIDDLDRWPGERQADLFSLYNDLRAAGGTLLAASRQPLPALALREDLRTRLGWGLIYEVHPYYDHGLTDADRERNFGFLRARFPVYAGEWGMPFGRPEPARPLARPQMGRAGCRRPTAPGRQHEAGVPSRTRCVRRPPCPGWSGRTG